MNRLDELTYIAIMVLLTIIILYMVIIIENVTSEVISTKPVDCYDRYGNKIDNQTCTMEIKCGIFGKLMRLCEK